MKMEQVELEAVERVFSEFANEDGNLDREGFVEAYDFIDASTSRAERNRLFEEADVDETKYISFGEFVSLILTPTLRIRTLKTRNIRDHVGLVSIKPAEGKYFDDVSDGVHVLLI